MKDRIIGRRPAKGCLNGDLAARYIQVAQPHIGVRAGWKIQPVITGLTVNKERQ
jgi:hypothetical protein